jgi:HD superfamily phosphohydrolase YqeK
MIAKRLAWIYRYEILDEAYFSGLIHDIGKLIIQQYFVDADQQICKLMEEGMESLEAEKEIWLAHHPQPWSEKAALEYAERFVERLQKWLDAGYGSCAGLFTANSMNCLN